MFQEFKKFIMRGNVLDLAVAVVMGTAFNRIVTSLVNDILMPPIGLVLGKADFSNLFINLSDTPYINLAEAQAAGAPTINYGVFVNNVISFLVVSLAVFFIIRMTNQIQRLHPAKPTEPPGTKPCPYCFSNIPAKATRCPHCTSQLAEV